MLRSMSLNPKTLVLLSVVLLGGVLGGTAAYRATVAASGAEATPRQTLVVDSADTGADLGARPAKVRDAQRPKFAPCRKPARLEAGKCVTEEVRTVTVPAQSSGTAARPPASAPASSGGSSSHHGDDDRDDDHGHHGDDDGDDHGGHGHGDDHDD